MTRVSTRSMRSWRKFHRYTLGYSKWISLVAAILLVVIALTGILLIHQDDLRVIQTGRVPLTILPDHYEGRLHSTRARQGTENILPEEHSVPMRWVILDLHTGEFFGKYGPLFYDLLGVMLMVLGTTGVVMYFKIRKKSIY